MTAPSVKFGRRLDPHSILPLGIIANVQWPTRPLNFEFFVLQKWEIQLFISGTLFHKLLSLETNLHMKKKKKNVLVPKHSKIWRYIFTHLLGMDLGSALLTHPYSIYLSTRISHNFHFGATRKAKQCRNVLSTL